MSEGDHFATEHTVLQTRHHNDDMDSQDRNMQDLDAVTSNPDLEPALLITSEEASEYHAPPAHLAARFYRNPTARRKSSATSSRRNSLSSTHSHGSSRSFRRNTSCHSTHVAQHLRRASILETRKARLADRAAHAEQVRLRAALAKAAPRGNATSSEERALAAQVARENHLAKVAAACAEEVQKAKQKAQEMKERKLAEERKTRQDMEERLAEADKRRAEYQRNIHARRMRRSSSQEKKLAVVDEDADADSDIKLVDNETAARRIQRTWRTRNRRRVVEAFVELESTIGSIRQKSFEEVGALISEPTMMHATSSMLAMVGLQTDEDDIASRSATRTFLSAYLIVAHPTFVFSKNGAQEQDLMTKAQELIVLFEPIVYRLASWNRFTPSPTHVEELAQVHATYVAAFNAWKAQDSSLLIETMIASFVELDAIWQSVKDDTNGGVADDYREGIRDSQVVLLSKIRKLAGPERADFLIKKAIRESRRRRGRRRTAAEVRPRVADSGSSDHVIQEASEAVFHDNDSISIASPLPEESQTGPQSFASMFSPIPSNRQLTHELAVNKEFRIPTAPTSSVRDAFNRKLCDSMRQGVEEGHGALWTTAMAECIRGKLLALLKPGNSLHNLISEALDTDHVYKQCSQGVFSYDKFFEFMASVLPKLCAPFRDEELKSLAEDLQAQTNDTTAMIEKLFRLLHFIDLLSIDYSNFVLMGAAPFLLHESAGYEQRAFARDLDSGKVTLQNTKRWLRNASVNMLTEAERRDPEQIRLPASRPTLRKIYFRGLVDLALCQSQQVESEWPETLAMDRERLSEMRSNMLRIVCAGASLLTAKNMLKRDVRAPWKTQANRLWELLSKTGFEAEDIAQRAFSILESGNNMPPATKTALQAACTRFLSQAAAGRFTDPVLKVLFQRLKSHVFARVSANSSQERVRAASTASEGLASAGLPEFSAHVGEMVDLLGRVGEVDWQGHGVWYEQIAVEVQGAGER